MDHTCNGTVRGASTCPACLNRETADLPPPSRFPRMVGLNIGKKKKEPLSAQLMPYTDDDGRDFHGLKKD